MYPENENSTPDLRLLIVVLCLLLFVLCLSGCAAYRGDRIVICTPLTEATWPDGLSISAKVLPETVELGK